jgi:predicted dehydrogenase
MANSQQLRMAIIGAGIISQSIHIPSMFRAGITLSAVCDLSPSRAKEVAAKLRKVGEVPKRVGY